MLKDSNSRMTNMMESPQCIGHHGNLPYDVCYPSREAILQQTVDAVKRIQATAVFVASDSDLMLDSLQQKCKVRTYIRTCVCAYIHTYIHSHHTAKN